ncbi:hypothetical protein ASF48_09140 [Rathayibacter sp. Leaf299]|uniref:four-carbon acid sugar kinase family protein n=1 Tax=unclassified Rathayibacter TaxID=2609250 RepID=UPI0006F35510|nr:MULTISPECIES: four-carbon acid sugar kinase family protein [unclassified Rathayibacter]KQQ20749.1 hypothetical protein ASF48_09140 [Rathayibacter sp. Leaf299]
MITESAALAGYPANSPVDAEEVRSAVEASGRVLVVLDDDPTGTQSVADLPVLMQWETSDFHWALGLGRPAVYVLTNTRSLDAATTARRTREIVRNASLAASELGLRLAFVSRGDSTLRGHFPLETDVIADSLRELTGTEIDAIILVPAFPDAGRITIGGMHYMRSAEGLLPIAETEFARDATFGYRSSDLRDYVAEKTEGRTAAEDVVLLDLTTVRSGPEAVAAGLAGLTGRTHVVVDIVTEDDLRSLALGLERAEQRGLDLLYRVGPPFVRARVGQEVHAPLTSDDVYGSAGSDAVGGLIVVGSHVGLTSRQLAALGRSEHIEATLEVDIAAVLDPDRVDDHVDAIVSSASDALGRGDVVVHTSRTLVRTDDPEESLDISRRVSAAVVLVVQRVLEARAPRFVIAKGGITSSDVAAFGLSIRHAIVRGPMLPGLVSLWEPADGPATGIPYVVFAGNVGDDGSLATVVSTLTHRPGAR